MKQTANTIIAPRKLSEYLPLLRLRVEDGVSQFLALAG